MVTQRESQYTLACLPDEFLNLLRGTEFKVWYHETIRGDTNCRFTDWQGTSDGRFDQRSMHFLAPVPAPAVLQNVLRISSIEIEEVQQMTTPAGKAHTPYDFLTEYKPGAFTDAFQASTNWSVERVVGHDGLPSCKVTCTVIVAFHARFVGSLVEQFMCTLALWSGQEFMAAAESHFSKHASARCDASERSGREASAPAHTPRVPADSMARRLDDQGYIASDDDDDDDDDDDGGGGDNDGAAAADDDDEPMLEEVILAKSVMDAHGTSAVSLCEKLAHSTRQLEARLDQVTEAVDAETRHPVTWTELLNEMNSLGQRMHKHSDVMEQLDSNLQTAWTSRYN